MSSFSGIPNFPQLTETNYADWSINTKAFLQSQKLWRIVNGTQTKPTSSSSPKPEELKAEEDWEDRSERACDVIMMSLSPGQKTHITAAKDDPVAIWTALKGVHEAQKPTNRYNAYDDLFSIRKQPDETLSALIMRSERAMHLIKHLRPTGFDIDKLDNELQCMALIRALPEEFAMFASTLMITNKLEKKDLVTAFHTEEIQRRRRTDDAANVAKANAVSSANKPTKTFYCTFHKVFSQP